MALRNFNQTNLRLPMRVWDLPTRLFHWAIAVLIVVSYVSVDHNWMQVHLLSGFTVLTLVLFRLIWGVVGSETSRFARFLRSPFAAFRHLAAFGRREPDNEVGHNEAGGWMVLVMLLCLMVQVGTGLFSNDDGATEGPLAKFVGKAWSDRISGWHGLNFDVLLALICFHIIAVIAYAVVKRHDLVRPMFTGKKKLPAATRAPRLVSPAIALLIVLVAGAAVWALATRV
jgi:cytochrome b